jgi:hypothetical protein
MLVELQFGTRLLRPTLSEASVSEVSIERLDATEDIPLRSICWLEQDDPEEFEGALADDRTVDDAARIVGTEHGCQYQVTYSRPYPGTQVYGAAIRAGGAFVSGHTGGRRWTLRYRFPDRESIAQFRAECDGLDIDFSVTSTCERDPPPCARTYGLSEPQREILFLATRNGYFEVPRGASLADLADELGVSSQAASERLRRGLESMVDRALLDPE